MGSAYQFHSWRVFVLVCAFPSVFAIGALTTMPESPRFYLEVGVWECMAVSWGESGVHQGRGVEGGVTQERTPRWGMEMGQPRQGSPRGVVGPGQEAPDECWRGWNWAGIPKWMMGPSQGPQRDEGP